MLGVGVGGAATHHTFGRGNVTLTAYCGDYQTMQNFTAANASNMSTGETRILKDVRDGQEYTVAKLADGKVWMVENLNLGANTLSTDLTSNNTNLSTTVTAATFNGWKKTTSSGTYNDGEFIYIAGTDTVSQTPYGVLYNYYAASAGTISGNTNSNNAIYDICPAGWRMPTGGTSGELQNLANQSVYNTLAKIRTPVSSGGASFALAGKFDAGTAPSAQEQSGRYWSSTVDSTTYMYRLGLFVSTSSVDSGSDNRQGGFSIRCIFAN